MINIGDFVAGFEIIGAGLKADGEYAFLGHRVSGELYAIYEMTARGDITKGEYFVNRELAERTFNDKTRRFLDD